MINDKIKVLTIIRVKNHHIPATIRVEAALKIFALHLFNSSAIEIHCKLLITLTWAKNRNPVA